MLDRTLFTAGITALVAFLFAAAPAAATVKCRCNNGAIVEDTSTDADDPDADDACSDACDIAGGGHVESPDQDDDSDDDEGREIGPDRPRSR